MVASRGQSVQDHYRRAQQALDEKRYADAEAEFRGILALKPDLAEAHANLGSIYFVRGEYIQAAKAFRQALKLKPTLARAEALLGLSEVRLGRVREALPHLEKGFSKCENDEWRLQAGLTLIDLYYAALDYYKALDVVRTLELAYPGNADVLYIAYRLHSDLGARAVASLVKAAPGSARLHQLTAELLESDGDFPRAVEQYRRALEIDPALPGGHRALGVALMNAGMDESTRAEAQKLFEQELALNPRDAQSEYQLGEICWLTNQPAEALRHFTRAVELHSNFTDALIAAGKAATAQALPERGLDFLRKAAEIDPNNEVAHYRLAQAYRKMGKTQEAEEELARFQQLRSAMESLRTIYRQVQGSRITAQKVE